MEVFDTGEIVSFDMEGGEDGHVVSPKTRKKEAKNKAKQEKKSKKKNGGRPESPREDEQFFKFGNPIFEDEFQSSVQMHKQKSVDSEAHTQNTEVNFGACFPAALRSAFHVLTVSKLCRQPNFRGKRQRPIADHQCG